MSQKRIYLCLAHMSGNRATLSLRQTMRQRVNKTTSGASLLLRQKYGNKAI